MIKNILQQFVRSSTSNISKHFRMKLPLYSAPRYNFCNKPPKVDANDSQKHSSLKMQHNHEHTNCSHSHHQQSNAHKHHHHHNGQPCDHDHSHDQQIEVPAENTMINIANHQADGVSFQTLTTKDSISILDKVSGTKSTDSNQLLILMFTCNVCQQRAIRSFTKTAYEKGVVLIKCQGCQNVHLIADNLKWFEDEPTNVEKIADVKRVSHSADVMKILNKVFQDSEKPIDASASINEGHQNKHNQKQK